MDRKPHNLLSVLLNLWGGATPGFDMVDSRPRNRVNCAFTSRSNPEPRSVLMAGKSKGLAEIAELSEVLYFNFLLLLLLLLVLLSTQIFIYIIYKYNNN